MRADAARNRQKLLDAAATLFARGPVDAVSLDDVVSAAGVGKGTLYRIFGDKSGLAAALLDERERALQLEILTGRPPLGPGVEPRKRLAAFVQAYLRYVGTHLELVAMSQQSRPAARFDTGSHRFWRAHLTYLYTASSVDQPQLAADVMLATMTAEQVGYWLRNERRSLDQLARHVSKLAAELA
jgi:AcrR family transcriptional regulator